MRDYSFTSWTHILITIFSIISELKKVFHQSDWLIDSLHDAVFTAPGGEYNIFLGLVTKLATFAILASKHGTGTAETILEW